VALKATQCKGVSFIPNKYYMAGEISYIIHMFQRFMPGPGFATNKLYLKTLFTYGIS